MPGGPAAGDAAPTSRRGAVLRGIGVSALNPKSLLFFVAFLPQFARPSASWPLTVQLIVLGGVWVVLIAGFYTVLGWSATRTLSGRPTLARTVSRMAGPG